MAEDTIKREDYAPITQELRVRLAVAALRLPKRMVEGLRAECDNIDAIHKALEEQNAELRETVFEHEISNVETTTFLDRLSDAADKREDVTLWDVDYLPYPVDADKVPIHAGDELYNKTEDNVGKVSCICLRSTGWEIYWYGWRPLEDYEFHHYHHHEPTVMDLLDELLMKWPDCEGPVEELALKKRIASCLQIAEVAE